jgi:hypothetical protein
MRKSAKRGRGATYASQPQEGCPLLHPLQGASCLSTPLQGGILKPPALRVVDDFLPFSQEVMFLRCLASGVAYGPMARRLLTPVHVQTICQRPLAAGLRVCHHVCQHMPDAVASA